MAVLRSVLTFLLISVATAAFINEHAQLRAKAPVVVKENAPEPKAQQAPVVKLAADPNWEHNSLQAKKEFSHDLVRDGTGHHGSGYDKFFEKKREAAEAIARAEQIAKAEKKVAEASRKVVNEEEIATTKFALQTKKINDAKEKARIEAKKVEAAKAESKKTLDKLANQKKDLDTRQKVLQDKAAELAAKKDEIDKELADVGKAEKEAKLAQKAIDGAQADAKNAETTLAAEVKEGAEVKLKAEQALREERLAQETLKLLKERQEAVEAEHKQEQESGSAGSKQEAQTQKATLQNAASPRVALPLVALAVSTVTACF